MPFSSHIAASFVLLCALGASRADATITNGDFSSGLKGWSTAGVVSTAASYTYSGTTISPTTGSQVAELISVGGVKHTAMETALGLPSNALQTFSDNLDHPLSRYKVQDGSVLTRTIVDASEYLSFDWNFWTSDSPSLNDFSFFTISGPGITGTDIILLSDVNNSPVALANNGGTGVTNQTGWQSYSYTLPATGDYTIGFGVANSKDRKDASYLYIDNVDSIVMPEPSAAFTAIALLGSGLLYPLRRRR